MFVTLNTPFPKVETAPVIVGVVMVGEVAKTIAPVPVGVTAVVIAKVPDEVIGPPETERMDGTVKPTEVTASAHVGGPGIATVPIILLGGFSGTGVDGKGVEIEKPNESTAVIW